jgi:hypothetical protein
MPYARTNYTLQDIQLGFRSIDTNRTLGNQAGAFGQQPTPHGHIHGADELHSHPLFARARVTAGDGPGTHSVMNETAMQNALVGVFNDAGMQPFLQQVDAGGDAHVNVNLTASPGAANIYKRNKAAVGATTTNAAVVAFFLKIRPNPGNRDVPIIQTCVPHAAPLQLVTKKGAVKGFKH